MFGEAENTSEDLTCNEDGVSCVCDKHCSFYAVPNLQEFEVKRKVKENHMGAIKGWLILEPAKYRDQSLAIPPGLYINGYIDSKQI